MASISWGSVAPAGSRRLIQRRWPPLLALAGLCGALFFYGLNAGELYRTESLRAIVAVEFLRSGDWLVPRLYGEPLLTKPPGAYAAIAAASAPFGGVTEWTARLPSAVAATLVVFLVYGCFRRHFGRTGGLTAAALLPCSLMWLDRAPSAEIDMLEVAWVAGAVLCFLRAVECRETAERPDGRSEWLWQQAALLCVAGGAMTKWTAPAFFYLTAIPFLLWRRRTSLLWSWPHLAAVGVAAAPCLAWTAAVGCSAGWAPLLDTVGARRCNTCRRCTTPGRTRGARSSSSRCCSWRRTCRGRRRRCWRSIPRSPGCGTSAAGDCGSCSIAGCGRTCCSGASSPATTSAMGCRCNPA